MQGKLVAEPSQARCRAAVHGHALVTLSETQTVDHRERGRLVSSIPRVRMCSLGNL